MENKKGLTIVFIAILLAICVLGMTIQITESQKEESSYILDWIRTGEEKSVQDADN